MCRKREVNLKVLKVPEMEQKVKPLFPAVKHLEHFAFNPNFHFETIIIDPNSNC